MKHIQDFQSFINESHSIYNFQNIVRHLLKNELGDKKGDEIFKNKDFYQEIVTAHKNGESPEEFVETVLKNKK